MRIWSVRHEHARVNPLQIDIYIFQPKKILWKMRSCLKALLQASWSMPHALCPMTHTTFRSRNLQIPAGLCRHKYIWRKDIWLVAEIIEMSHKEIDKQNSQRTLNSWYLVRMVCSLNALAPPSVTYDSPTCSPRCLRAIENERKTGKMWHVAALNTPLGDCAHEVLGRGGGL